VSFAARIQKSLALSMRTFWPILALAGVALAQGNDTAQALERKPSPSSAIAKDDSPPLSTQVEALTDSPAEFNGKQSPPPPSGGYGYPVPAPTSTPAKPPPPPPPPSPPTCKATTVQVTITQPAKPPVTVTAPAKPPTTVTAPAEKPITVTVSAEPVTITTTCTETTTELGTVTTTSTEVCISLL
jgi:hypothetical protein